MNKMPTNKPANISFNFGEYVAAKSYTDSHMGRITNGRMKVFYQGFWLDLDDYNTVVTPPSQLLKKRNDKGENRNKTAI